MDPVGLRRLLERSGSYAVIGAAAASGGRHAVLQVNLSGHIGAVYDRLERAADPSFPGLAELRLAVLVHEEHPGSLPGLLSAAGCRDWVPTVVAVIGGFGALWRVTSDHDLAEYAVTQRGHLAPLLLFELAHEGRATREMERAAELAGLDRAFGRWVERLPAALPV